MSRLYKAITFATKVHSGVNRKGKDIPYITHPLTVALILSRVTQDENIIIAGILHDTIEDCEPYGSVTKEFLEKEFNAEVARMVNDVTEKDKTLPWFERKMEALKHIKHMQNDSLLVKSADVLHNLTDLNEEIKQNGVIAFKNFKASKEDIILRYEKLIQEIENTRHENPLINDLKEKLKELHDLAP